MEKQSFGFTGSSTILEKFSIKLGRWWYILFAVAGTVIVSIAVAFVGTYSFSQEWKSVNGVLEGINLIVKQSLGLFVSWGKCYAIW
jgi:hypothetical protein